ncbi:unnamed protein product, partial [Aphanomyces euteiches]
MGDVITMQYGEAHKNVVKSKENIKAWELAPDQDAINLFLGNYIPFLTTSPLWLLESDYYLHNLYVQRGTSLSEMGPFHRVKKLLDGGHTEHDKQLYQMHRTPFCQSGGKPALKPLKLIEKQSPAKYSGSLS